MILLKNAYNKAKKSKPPRELTEKEEMEKEFEEIKSRFERLDGNNDGFSSKEKNKDDKKGNGATSMENLGL